MGYLDTKGRIFDIQRFSVHDGPGIRTIVFLKGCPLRCQWCCNPESQSREIETMRVAGETKIIGQDVTVAQVMETVEKDRSYYRRSGGGITLSGGEATMQPQFAADLLQASKMSGIGTAMESMGCCSYKNLELILPWLDTYLMDIKHTDPEKHKAFTGVRNDLMLENARKVAASGMTNLVIRVPVIPTFNDTKKEIQDIAVFAGQLPGVRRIHLLPYHRLGSEKYIGLDRVYKMEEIVPPEMEHMLMLKDAVEMVSDLDCRIGG